MASQMSQSSVGTIVEDLVSDRSIPLKVTMIVLNVAQLISSWIAVIYFIKSYDSWSTLDLTLSAILLITGNYIIPCIANAVIYGRRWKRSSVANRRQMSEENKQAWVCLRIALSLLGIPTVGRYIETIIVSKKLSYLEKHHVNDAVASHKEESQLNPTGTSRMGTSVSQLKSNNIPKKSSVVSGMSHASSMNAIPENNQQKIRKARRQYKRCEHDGSLMALISGSTGAGPMAIGLGFLYFQREEVRAMGKDQVVVVWVSFALNLLWLAATLTHFYPARHVLSEAEFERGIGATNFGALCLLFSSHVVQVTLRVLCFVIFVNWFYAYVCIPIVFHWILGTILLISYRAYMKSRSVGRPLGERVRNATGSFFSALFFGYVGIFDFVNGNEGKTRLRYLIYYTFYYIENIIMLVVWILRNPRSQIQYPIPFICCILGLFWLGFLLFQLYLFYFSYSPYGSSIIGLCKKKKIRQGNYAVEVREPVFGVPVSQSAVPLWKMNQKDEYAGDGRSTSGYNNRNPHLTKTHPAEYNQGKPPSIMSSQSTKELQSICSQPSSQANILRDKRTKNPIIKPPPVLQQKVKQENSKPPKKVDLSSDSSSNEDLPVFSAKPVHVAQSQPDLTESYSLSMASPSKIQKIPDPVRNVPSNRKPPASSASLDAYSRSLDNLAMQVPATVPNKTTSRISGPGNTKSAPRALPSKDQVKNLHQKREVRKH